MAIALGVLVVAGIFLAALALQDIYHGREPDFTMEWNMVRVAFLLMLMYVALSGVTLWRLATRREGK